MNLDIRHDAVQPATPIGSSPGVGVVEALIPGRGKAVRKTLDKVAPYFRGAQIADLSARDRFHIGRDSFLDPVMLPGNLRKREMDHFMRHDPVVVQIGFGGGMSQRDSDLRGAVGNESPAEDDALAVFERDNIYIQMANRKAAVIFGDGAC